MKNLKGQATIIAIVFIALASVVTGYLYLQNRDLKSQLGSDNGATNTPIPTKTEVDPSTPTQPATTPTDEASNWKTYNYQQTFEIKVPNDLKIFDKGYGRAEIGDYFSVGIYPSNPEDCRGDCSIIETKESKTISGLGVRRLTGWWGAIGGNTPQSYIEYVIPHDGKYVYLQVQELSFSASANPTREKVGKVNEGNSKLLDQILSTFKFSDQVGSPKTVGFYDFSGKLILNGYLTTLERKCSFTEDNNCKVKLAVFTVLKADNPQFSSYLKDLAGNAFVTSDGIVLGCMDEAKKQVNSSNDADTGTVNNLIFDGQYDLLVGSSPSNPVNLSLEKPKLTGGRGAPDCYSHFRNFKVY